MVYAVYSTKNWHVTVNKTRECVIMDLVVSCDELKAEELVDISPSLRYMLIPTSCRWVARHSCCTHKSTDAKMIYD